jgi:uncharacterized membrane protein
MIFLVAWLLYEACLKVGSRPGDVTNSDLRVIWRTWMRNMVARDNRFMDGQLIGQALSSNSFFASSNLVLIAAAAGTLFHGQQSYESATTLAVIKTSSLALFEVQPGLIVLTLARGLLAFTWSIRQLNYCLAAFGATPIPGQAASAEEYVDAVARLLSPAPSSFNAWVRSYYFAAAATAWLFGRLVFAALLFWRQRASPAAAALGSIRRLLEDAAIGRAHEASAHGPAAGATSGDSRAG